MGEAGLRDGLQAAYGAVDASADVRTRPELLRRTTFQEFMAFLDEADEAERYEWIDGWIVQQQQGGTRRHSALTVQLISLLVAQLDRAAWQVLVDHAVLAGRRYRYADIVVDPAGEDDLERLSRRPALVIEVLSETSDERDRLTKPVEYGQIETLSAYMVADQFSRHCSVWLRDRSGCFPADPVIYGDGATIEIEALSVRLPVAEIYRGIIDPPEKDRADA